LSCFFLSCLGLPLFCLTQSFLHSASFSRTRRLRRH
jgi:hypothetical protein